MFLNFFYALRSAGIPCSTSEYLDLLNVIGVMNSTELDSFNSKRFYQLARNCLVKNTKYFDHFDIVFSKVFGDLINQDEEFKKNLMDWLKKSVEHELDEDRKKNAMKLPEQNLIDELLKRLKEQKERHDTGNKWIGTGGTSAFGNSGFNSAGVRLGGEGKNRSGLMVAGRQNYQEYRTDQIFNVRQIKTAVKKLRNLKKQGRIELNIDKSIKKTCANMGEIELVFEKSRKNNMKLILLMDVGGSMSSFARLVSTLFSGLHQINHFKKFEYYYFHNIFYDYVYKDARFSQEMKVEELMKKLDKETRVIIVGDAYMAPYELFQMTGGMREFYFTLDKSAKGSEKTGHQRVQAWGRSFPKTIWLNPEPSHLWSMAPTISAISKEIKMYSLSIDGLVNGIEYLRK